jgi:hypothetical protein
LVVLAIVGSVVAEGALPVVGSVLLDAVLSPELLFASAVNRSDCNWNSAFSVASTLPFILALVLELPSDDALELAAWLCRPACKLMRFSMATSSDPFASPDAGALVATVAGLTENPVPSTKLTEVAFGVVVPPATGVVDEVEDGEPSGPIPDVF